MINIKFLLVNLKLNIDHYPPNTSAGFPEERDLQYIWLNH